MPNPVAIAGGIVVDLDLQTLAYGYDGNNNLTTLTFNYNGHTYQKTLSYTSNQLTGETPFVQVA